MSKQQHEKDGEFDEERGTLELVGGGGGASYAPAFQKLRQSRTRPPPPPLEPPVIATGIGMQALAS